MADVPCRVAATCHVPLPPVHRKERGPAPQQSMSITALKLERKLDSRIWGGNALGEWLRLADAPAQLAESWQVYEHNRIAEGRYAGRTLGDLTSEQGAALVGTRSFARYGADFPLLAKFIDAGDSLSVQVHPDDAYAHIEEAATGFHGKTEAWYILRAEPGAQLIHGLNHTSSRQEFAEAIETGTLDAVVRYVPVQAGDTIFVPAGTVHAINAGILLFEIQQKSDLTYRVYDYNRRDASGYTRELHLDRALEVIDYHAADTAQVPPRALPDGQTLLVECPYFAMERWELAAPHTGTTDAATFDIFTAIEGEGVVRWAGGECTLMRGESVVLPATLGAYTITPDGDLTLLRCYVPESA